MIAATAASTRLRLGVIAALAPGEWTAQKPPSSAGLPHRCPDGPRYRHGPQFLTAARFVEVCELEISDTGR